MTNWEDVFVTGIRQLGIEVLPDAKERMNAFLDLLLEKNKVMNLTAVTEKGEAISRHLIDSLAVLNAADLKGKKVIDVGCGPGFPGMPLKLYDLTFNITLLDSQNKRIDFLKEASEKLGIETDLICARAEDAAGNKSYREQFDIAVSRAVAPLNILCELALPFVKVGGMFLAMKMAGCEKELDEASKAIKTLGGEVAGYFDYRLPLGDLSFRIIKIEKKANTPVLYPRRFNKIKAKPL
ncbi:MAG: 16S rRNA (guanine(527)-N(7))-methyltransferase RsmG [Clostridiales bacterium]|nr:16S rRNA (guanine(527)-N(7))-methyltransferase RsmG [Clostridiales bacterium]